MQQPPNGGGGGNARPKIVLFEDTGDNSVNSELDLDLYDTDEIPEPWPQQPGISLGGIPASLVQQAPAANSGLYYSRGIQPSIIKEQNDARSTMSSQNHTHRETASSTSGTAKRYPRRPVNPEPTIRTDFTTKPGDGGGGGNDTPKDDDNYDQIFTPPGDPPLARPEELIHPAYAKSARSEISMRAEWILGLIVVGFGVGAALQTQHPGPQVAYWLTTIGDLYVSMTACFTLPMAFCQVVTSTAELVNNGKLRRAWVYTIIYFSIMSFVSVFVSIGISSSFRSRYQRHSTGNLRLPHAHFAFKCHDGTFLEQQPSGILTCTGDQVDKNTTFIRLIDISQRLGIEDTIDQVDISGFILALLSAYVPQNMMYAFAAGQYLSVMVLAVVVGVAVGKSYTCPQGMIKRSKNPIFRLVSHVYLSLFAMLEWVQNCALWATVPILIGAVLIIPDVGNTISLARYYMIAALLAASAQSLVITPLLFFIVTRQNPYRWIAKMLTPMGYGIILQTAFLSLPMATKAVLRSNEITPDIFGGIYPVLSAVNRSHFAIGIPIALHFVAAFSGCAIEMTVGDTLLMFGINFIGCFGDTTLKSVGMAYFLMAWRAFCQNEDTPYAVIMISTVGIYVYRLSSFFGTMTNLLLIRMISHTVDGGGDEKKIQRPLDDVFHDRESNVSMRSSVPVVSTHSM